MSWGVRVCSVPPHHAPTEADHDRDRVPPAQQRGAPGPLRQADFGRRDLSTLAKGYYGPSIMPIAIVEELRRRLPRMHLFNFNGQTGMSAVARGLSPEDQLRTPASAGLPATPPRRLAPD
jgi:hypothetical protein